MEQKYNELEILIKNKQLADKIASSLMDLWRYLNDARRQCNNKDEAISLFIKDEKTKIDFVNFIEKKVFTLNGKKVLDIGCGKGGVVVACALCGASEVVGSEPEEGEVEISKLRVKSYGLNNVTIIKGSAEEIPFPNEYFDLVSATSVLEHVKNPVKAIKEMARVTKRNGFCCTTTPNPVFPREAHYKIFWPPFLPKFLGKIYLIIRGFNPDFFIKDMIYPYPSISKIEKTFRKSGMEVTNITENDILVKFNQDISLVQNRVKRKILRCLKILKMNLLFAKIIIFFRFYPGVLIIGRKK